MTESSRLAISTPYLEMASLRSAEFLAAASETLSNKFMMPSTDDLVAFGSLARHEFTPNSDLDYLVITAEENCDPQIPQALKQIIEEELITKHGLNEPGSTGLFGRRVSVNSLVENIGLGADTNENLTRRILFLEESVSLINEEFHQKTLEQIIRSYLSTETQSKLPRFLLNDIIRYWRTVAIDFEAKSRSTPTALRYFKLLIPRKLSFLSGLIPLIRLNQEGALNNDEKCEFLTNLYLQPSSHRLLNFLESCVENDSRVNVQCRNIAEALEYFVGKSQDSSWRKEIETEYNRDDYKNGLHYREIKEKAQNLHNSLGELFLSEKLKEFTREYLLF